MHMLLVLGVIGNLGLGFVHERECRLIRQSISTGAVTADNWKSEQEARDDASREMRTEPEFLYHIDCRPKG